MSIHALVMDIGNVLLRVDPACVEKFLKERGLYPGEHELRRLLAIARLHERGGIDANDFLSRCRRLLDLPVGGEEIVREAWNAVFPPDALIEGVFAACRRLHERGVRLVLLSNTNETHIRFMRSQWPEIFRECDSAVYSCRVRALKPDAAIYEYAIRTCALIPERTLYFDDKAENVRAGAAFGLRAHVLDADRLEQTFFPFLEDARPA